MAMVVIDSSSTPKHFSVRMSNQERAMTAPQRPDTKNIASCNGFSGDCLSYSDDEDKDDSNVNENEDDGAVRYISYEALKKNIIPCSQRGNSYYNCRTRRPANPYTRGCSYITHCARSNE
ncbi:hypothetical protein M0R45_001071 [Rubus argutus]|uniref:Uncharacterized protein n=1 Tax=Rubus argutus TaxID=59490 RepID=A0AAW1VK27_RUBAR